MIDESRTDEIDITDVMSSIRLIHKAILKKEKKSTNKQTAFSAKVSNDK